MRARDEYNANGVILFEDSKRVVIATGLDTPSDNGKTGDMIQIWILHRTLSPIGALRAGRNKDICGTCKHQGVRKMIGAYLKVVERRCYVQIDKAPTGIWRAYRRGRYRRVEASEYSSLFAGREVRFGAYGDPVYIPIGIVRAIVAVASKHTGYSHQFSDPQYAEYAELLMVSVDNDAEALQAIADGRRYFRVRAFGDTTVWANEIVCPASDEGGKRTTCKKCGLCNGTKFGPGDPRKSITIQDHSAIKTSKPLVQITGLAA